MSDIKSSSMCPFLGNSWLIHTLWTKLIWHFIVKLINYSFPGHFPTEATWSICSPLCHRFPGGKNASYTVSIWQNNREVKFRNTDLNSHCRASLVAQTVKNPPAMWETWVRSLVWEYHLEEGMATHSSVLAWRIPMDRGAWWVIGRGIAKS